MTYGLSQRSCIVCKVRSNKEDGCRRARCYKFGGPCSAKEVEMIWSFNSQLCHRSEVHLYQATQCRSNEKPQVHHEATTSFLLSYTTAHEVCYASEFVISFLLHLPLFGRKCVRCISSLRQSATLLLSLSSGVAGVDRSLATLRLAPARYCVDAQRYFGKVTLRLDFACAVLPHLGQPIGVLWA